MRISPVDYHTPLPPPPANDPDWVLRRNAVGMREMFAIAEAWQLPQDQLAVLLGASVRTLQRWRRQAGAGTLELSGDTVERMSYLLGISKALKILFPTPANRLHWLRNANTGATFNGQAPLERLLQGQVADLYVVRRTLDAARG